MIGGVVVAWMLSSPISERLVTSQYVVKLVPYVKGQVKVVHAQVNQPIKKGEILLEIDPTPYQYTVNQIQASLEQAKSAVANAKANLNKAIAADELAKIKETNALGTQRQYAGAISTQDVAVAVQSRLEADATVQQAQAAVVQAQSNVPVVKAQLDDALFNLDQCKMRAPGDGYVVNWLVQPGTMLSPVTAAAAGTFVDTSDIALVAVFPQNYLTYVEKGDAVEIVLDPYPGTIFTAKVDHVIPATAAASLHLSEPSPTQQISGRTAYMRCGSTSTTKLSLGNCHSAPVEVRRSTPLMANRFTSFPRW